MPHEKVLLKSLDFRESFEFSGETYPSIRLKSEKFFKSKHEIGESKLVKGTLCHGAKNLEKYFYTTLDLGLCAAKKSFARIA